MFKMKTSTEESRHCSESFLDASLCSALTFVYALPFIDALSGS